MIIDKQKIKYWTKLISITGFAQVIVQAVGFISGILVIRLLPVEEYALYTLANTMQGTMTVLSDGGISTGVMAQGGKIWQNRQKLGAVLNTGMDLRRKFAVFSLIVSLPILAYLLLHNGATWLKTVLITVSLIPAFYAALSDSLLQIPVKLHQAITSLQRNQVEVSVGRLILTGLTLFAFPWAFIAIIANGIPRILGNIRLRKIAEDFADKEAEVEVEERKEILKVVKRELPGSIYFAFSGQISIWLISITRNTTSMAQLGALGRISILLSLISIVLNTIIIPRFARLPNIKSILIKHVVKIISLLFVICLIIIGIVYACSTPILWILGKNYSGLNFELILLMINSCIALLYGTVYLLYSRRGYILHPAINILTNICLLLSGIIIFDISSLTSLLYMNIFINCFITIREFICMIYMLNHKIKE